MTADAEPAPASLHFPLPGAGRVRAGVDTVHIPRIADSLARHGERFMQRLFTPAEQAYAMAAPLHTAERLAARFAAKEAVIKALALPEVGVDWCDIEVMRAADGACTLSLHGRAAAQARLLGVCELVLSLSHDGGQAIAMVVAYLSPAAGSGAWRPDAPHPNP